MKPNTITLPPHWVSGGTQQCMPPVMHEGLQVLLSPFSLTADTHNDNELHITRIFLVALASSLHHMQVHDYIPRVSVYNYHNSFPTTPMGGMCLVVRSYNYRGTADLHQKPSEWGGKVLEKRVRKWPNSLLTLQVVLCSAWSQIGLLPLWWLSSSMLTCHCTDRSSPHQI